MTNIERNVKQIDHYFHHGDLTQIDEKDFQRFNLHFQHCDLTGPPLIQKALDAKVTSRYRQTSEESTNILYNLSRFELKPNVIFGQTNICRQLVLERRWWLKKWRLRREVLWTSLTFPSLACLLGSWNSFNVEPTWSLLVYWVFVMNCARLISMMHSDNIRHAELRFLYMTTNCAFVTVGPFPFHDQLHGFLQHLASKWFGRVILTAIQTIFQCEELSDTPNWASFVWQQTVLSLLLDHFLFEYMKGLQQINPYSNMRNRQEINEIVSN